MDKSPDAFRTISEVAEVLDTPAHVLRFWESRFPQIRPVKRAGGRRYYRPADVALLLGIKHLLHDEGMTIRGVQKVLREQGVRQVSGMSGQEVILDDAETAEAALEAALAANFGPLDDGSDLAQDQIETAQIVALEDALRARSAQENGGALTSAAPVDPEPAEVLPLFEAAPKALTPSALTPPPMFETTDIGQDGANDDDDAPPPEEPLPAAAPSSSLIAELESLQLVEEDALVERTAPPPLVDRDAPLLLRLRALPAGSLATPEARDLRDRLAALADRIASPPPPSAI